MIIDFDIKTSDIRRLVPAFVNRQAPRDLVWQEAMKRAGFTSFAEIPHTMDFDRRGEMGTSTEMSPYFRVGRLSFEPNSSAAKVDSRADYLKSVDYPALMMFRDKSAVLNYSQLSHESISRLVQSYLVHALCKIDPIVVKCTAIDMQNFGGSFGLLTSAVPNLEMLTSTHEVDDFFDKLPDDMRERNKVKGYRFPYLYEYNRTHKESTLPYHFILINSFESDLSEKHKSLLTKLIANSNSAKAGIYFLILFQTKDEFLTQRKCNNDLAAIMELADSGNTSKLEIIDPAGLDTANDGRHQHLMVTPDIANDTDLDRLASYCLRHLQTIKPDPVCLPLPNLPEDLWKESAAEGIVAPIGKARGSEVMLSLGGQAIVHNALVGGAVGTGKTSLLNAIILQCAALYSPEELRISILDYKNGTEFAFYESIPHLHALSLGPGTKFGQDLLGHLQAELQRRAELFKSVGATNLENYRLKVKEVLPRHLVVIDEFQVLLQDRKRGMESGQMLEDLVRRGRSFGFNFILSTQSLKDGALTPAAAANIGCRICLRLSETECCNFLSTDNILPSTFEYTGQAVYNDKEGRREGNSEFRVAYYPNQELKSFVSLISSLRDAKAIHDRHVYHGSVERQKTALSIVRPAAHVYIGLEDGIPPLSQFSSLDPESGQCLILGRGASAESFKANLIDELNQVLTQNSWCEWTALEVVRAIEPLGDIELKGSTEPDCRVAEDSVPKVVLLELSAKDAANMNLQSCLTKLIALGKTKVFLFAQNSEVLRSLFINPDAEEMIVYCDQRSFASARPGSEMIFDKNTVAVFFPGDDSHSMVNIPLISNSN